MKCLVLTALLTSATPSVVQGQTPAQPDTFCAMIADTARNTMTARLNNFDLSKMMNLIDTIFAGDPDMIKLDKQIAIDAYSLPAYESLEFQQHAIETFTNDQTVKCYKTYAE